MRYNTLFYITLIGVSLSISISWSLYKSIGWAIFHGVWSWFYVIYYAIKY
jgi:hypothetical protein